MGTKCAVSYELRSANPLSLRERAGVRVIGLRIPAPLRIETMATENSRYLFARSLRSSLMRAERPDLPRR